MVSQRILGNTSAVTVNNNGASPNALIAPLSLLRLLFHLPFKVRGQADVLKFIYGIQIILHKDSGI